MFIQLPLLQLEEEVKFFPLWPSCLKPVPSDIQMAEYTGGKVHIAHLSTKNSVQLVREAKAKGIKVTAEATPHHFSLTDDTIKAYDTNFKMNPPLRTQED